MTDNEQRAIELLQTYSGSAWNNPHFIAATKAALDEAEARAVVILERRAKELDDLMLKTGDHSAGLRATALRDAVMEIGSDKFWRETSHD